ncbi:MAG: lytic transglycosylase domain-containing protein [Oscillospiraceae bacterium]|nr:lytic transglycosylase domain-containing protein [Oscillospiraceae bacterium]
MAQYKRKKVKKKKGFIASFFKLILIMSIMGAVVYFAVFVIAPDFLHDKVDDIRRLQYPQKYSEYVEKYSDLYDVDKNLVYAVIHTESHFEVKDKSSAGAMGLMQITSECFDFLKKNIPDDTTDYPDSALYNAETNIKFGTYFLGYLLDRYDNREKTALAAYNAGFGCVDEWLQNPEYSSDGKNLDTIIYPETSSYVDKVGKAKNMYQKLY